MYIIVYYNMWIVSPRGLSLLPPRVSPRTVQKTFKSTSVRKTMCGIRRRRISSAQFPKNPIYIHIYFSIYIYIYMLVPFPPPLAPFNPCNDFDTSCSALSLIHSPPPPSPTTTVRFGNARNNGKRDPCTRGYIRAVVAAAAPRRVENLLVSVSIRNSQ